MSEFGMFCARDGRQQSLYRKPATIAKHDVEFIATRRRGGVDEGFKSILETPKLIYNLPAKNLLFGTLSG